MAAASGGLMLAMVLPQQAVAVPSYARQTGLACEACHTVFPQLTPFGRVFKASGYTLSNTNKVQDVDSLKHYLMTLSDTPAGLGDGDRIHQLHRQAGGCAIQQDGDGLSPAAQRILCRRDLRQCRRLRPGHL